MWLVWSDERVNRTNSYSRPKTKIKLHSGRFFRLYQTYRIGRGLRTTGVKEPDTKSNIISTFFRRSYKHN